MNSECTLGSAPADDTEVVPPVSNAIRIRGCGGSGSVPTVLMKLMRSRTIRRLSAWGGLACLLVLAAYFMATRYSGAPAGDTYTYIRFARLLGRGQIAMTGPLRDLIEAYIEGTSAWITPIWNTVILPDGRWVYSVAPGYPLVLALVFRFAGEWAMMHANIVLQLLMLAVFFGLIVGTLRPRAWATTAALVGVVLLLSWDTVTLQQFVHLWREPLMFLLLLLAAGAYLLMDRYPRCFWLIPVCLGYACAVKESNILYAVWMGLSVLLHPAFRARPQKWRAIVFGSLLFLVGCAPLLLQNWSYTGRPWVSLYVVRETREFSVGDVGAGFSMGNLGMTARRYWGLYKPLARQGVPLLLVAVWGVWRHRKHPVTVLMGGWVLLHVGLCLQWGNAEFRHIYFANLPVVFFAALGVHDLISRVDRADRVPLRQGIVYALVLIALLPGVRSRQPPKSDFRVRDWQRLVHELRSFMEPGNVVFVNRPLRDLVGGYSDMAAMMLQGFVHATQHEPARLIKSMAGGDSPVYWIDAADRSPRSLYRDENLTQLDLKHVLYGADPVPVGKLDMTAHRMERMLRQDTVVVYRLHPWSRRVVERHMDVDLLDTAFLSVYPRGVNADLRIAVDDVLVDHDFKTGTFIPVPGTNASFTVVASRAGGGNMPAYLDIEPVCWHDAIVLPVGQYAQPDDRLLFEAVDPRYGWFKSRGFRGSASMRIPVREGSNLFSVVQMELAVGDDTWDAVTVHPETGPAYALPAHDRNVWITVPRRSDGPRWAGYRPVRVAVKDDRLIILSRIVVHSVWSSWDPDPVPADALGMIVGGYLVPRDAGETAWRYRESGREIMGSTLISATNPLKNPFVAFVRPLPGGGMPQLQWDGVGVMDVLERPLDRVFVLSPDDDLAPMLARNMYAGEADESGAFRWTGPDSHILLPVADAASAYRLTLKLAYRGMGGQPRWPADVIVGGTRNSIHVDNQVGTYDWRVTDLSPTNGWIRVDIETPLWSPTAYGSGDSRQLGIRWYGLVWEPLAD